MAIILRTLGVQVGSRGLAFRARRRLPETCLAFATVSVFGSKVCLKSFNWGYIVIGIMEKKMEPTIVYWSYTYTYMYMGVSQD